MAAVQEASTRTPEARPTAIVSPTRAPAPRSPTRRAIQMPNARLAAAHRRSSPSASQAAALDRRTPAARGAEPQASSRGVRPADAPANPERLTLDPLGRRTTRFADGFPARHDAGAVWETTPRDRPAYVASTTSSSATHPSIGTAMARSTSTSAATNMSRLAGLRRARAIATGSIAAG